MTDTEDGSTEEEEGRKRTEETAARPSAKPIKCEGCDIHEVAQVRRPGSSPRAASKIAV